MFCPCCMENHEVQIHKVIEKNVYKNYEISYDAEYCYCPVADEYYANEKQIQSNFKNMDDAWHELV